MRKIIQVLIGGICTLWCSFSLSAQQADTVWTLNKCIEYALQQNISIQKAALNSDANKVYLEQSQASRFPSLNASVSQNFRWSKQLDATSNTYGPYSNSSGTSFDVNSNVRLYNGFKIKNTIKQSELAYKAGQLDVETMKETVSLAILDAYLQVLYADEQLKNAEKQIESTTRQLQMAEERMHLGAISRADYLQVKSELASEYLTLANAQSLLTLNKVNLMQLMDLPTSTNFSVVHPDFTGDILQLRRPVVDSVYNEALRIKPQIKSAEINRQSSDLDIAIAKAAYQPVLSLNGGVSSSYSYPGLDFSYQVRNRITPSVGLTLSIPIYQNKQAKSGVSLAQISSKTAALNELNTKNQLRKDIEQSCSDVLTAEKKYEASLEQFTSVEESYNVASEKYNQGLLNSVDFLIQRTKFISAESELIQAKYNLVFSYKTLDFYAGNALTL